MNSHLGQEIGRGGYGIVYECKTDSNMCIKKSFKKTNCRQWSNEFKKIKILQQNMGDKINFGRTHLLVPTKFHESDNECFMEMPRIHNPNNDSKTLHPLLGEKNYNHIDKKRGIFKGIYQLKTELGLTDEFLEKISYDLGIMMGSIHFKGKNDAYDIEVYLGCKNVCPGRISKLGLYIADFDLSEPIEKYDKETIDRMIWSLDAVPYFPIDGKMFQLFKNGYSKAAGKNNQHVVDLIFQRYPI